MKRIIIVTFVLVLGLVLSSCDYISSPNDNSDWKEPVIGIFDLSSKDSIQKIFDAYPQKMYIKDLEELNVYAYVTGEIKNQEVWDVFIASVEQKENAAIIIVLYTIEGDPILLYVSYLDGLFYYAHDSSRDRFGGDETTFEGPFQYMIEFEDETRLVTILSEIEYASFEEYQNDSGFHYTRILLYLEKGEY